MFLQHIHVKTNIISIKYASFFPFSVYLRRDVFRRGWLHQRIMCRRVRFGMPTGWMHMHTS